MRRNASSPVCHRYTPPAAERHAWAGLLAPGSPLRPAFPLVAVACWSAPHRSQLRGQPKYRTPFPLRPARTGTHDARRPLGQALRACKRCRASDGSKRACPISGWPQRERARDKQISARESFALLEARAHSPGSRIPDWNGTAGQTQARYRGAIPASLLVCPPRVLGLTPCAMPTRPRGAVPSASPGASRAAGGARRTARCCAGASPRSAR